MWLEKVCEREFMVRRMCLPSASKRGATLRKCNSMSKLTFAMLGVPNTWVDTGPATPV